MFDNLDAYALYHPTVVGEEYYACSITGVPFPKRVRRYHPGGHLDIWCFETPVKPGFGAIRIDPFSQVLYVDESDKMMSVIFFVNALNTTTAKELNRKLLEKRREFGY